MADNLYGMYYGGPDDAASNVYNLMGSALDLLKTGTVPRFNDATDRDSKLTAPVRGQVCWVGSPGVGQVFDGTAWQQAFPTPVTGFGKKTFTQQAVAGATPVDLAVTVMSFPYPYIAVMNASVKVTGLTSASAGALWMNQTGAAGAITYASAEIPGDNQAVNCSGFIQMPNGGQLTVKATLNLSPNAPNVQVYTDERHSFLQGFALPLLTHF